MNEVIDSPKSELGMDETWFYSLNIGLKHEHSVMAITCIHDFLSDELRKNVVIEGILGFIPSWYVIRIVWTLIPSYILLIIAIPRLHCFLL